MQRKADLELVLDLTLRRIVRWKPSESMSVAVPTVTKTRVTLTLPFVSSSPNHGVDVDFTGVSSEK